MIVTGMTSVHPLGQISDYQNTIHDDDCIANLQRLTTAVHQRGAMIALQLMHAGREAFKYMANKHLTAIAPSFIQDDPCCGANYRCMSEDNIGESAKAFGSGARRAREAGFDAVQINSKYAYLIGQFLSHFSNRRKDQWGGSLKNRLRFLKAIYQEVRANVGSDFPVMIKLDLEDRFAKDREYSEDYQVAVECADWGFDALEIGQGVRCKGFFPATFMNAIDRSERRAYLHQWCHEVKSSISMPVTIACGVRSEGLMETVIHDGGVDFIALHHARFGESDFAGRWAAEDQEPQDCGSSKTRFNTRFDPFASIGAPI